MPASTFILRPKEGGEIWKRMKEWIKKNPNGTKLNFKGRELEVTEASCGSIRMGIANYREICEIEIRDKQTGGLANFNIDYTEEGSPRGVGHPYSEFEMIDADFPYPLEFDIAKKEFGIQWMPRTAQCFEMGDMRYCPAIQVVGGGLAAQKADVREYLRRKREEKGLPERGTGILSRTARRREYPPLSEEERKARHEELYGRCDTRGQLKKKLGDEHPAYISVGRGGWTAYYYPEYLPSGTKTTRHISGYGEGWQQYAAPGVPVIDTRTIPDESILAWSFGSPIPDLEIEKSEGDVVELIKPEPTGDPLADFVVSEAVKDYPAWNTKKITLEDYIKLAAEWGATIRKT